MLEKNEEAVYGALLILDCVTECLEIKEALRNHLGIGLRQAA